MKKVLLLALLCASWTMVHAELVVFNTTPNLIRVREKQSNGSSTSFSVESGQRKSVKLSSDSTVLIKRDDSTRENPDGTRVVELSPSDDALMVTVF